MRRQQLVLRCAPRLAGRCGVRDAYAPAAPALRARRLRKNHAGQRRSRNSASACCSFLRIVGRWRDLDRRRCCRRRSAIVAKCFAKLVQSSALALTQTAGHRIVVVPRCRSLPVGLQGSLAGVQECVSLCDSVPRCSKRCLLLRLPALHRRASGDNAPAAPGAQIPAQMHTASLTKSHEAKS